MGVLLDQIAKARRRARGFPMDSALAAAGRGEPPGMMASAQVLSERQAFLQDMMGDRLAADRVFERIIAGNELQEIGALARGYRASHAVCRIQIGGNGRRVAGFGTGFLIAPGLLITNHHVFPDAATAAASLAQFDFEYDADGIELSRIDYAIDPTGFFQTSQALDFSVIRLGTQTAGPPTDPVRFGYLPLLGMTGKVAEGEWLSIVQHPNAEHKQVSVRENRLLGRTDDALWYSTDTLGGSSGSPVFNNDWMVVALHHSGVPEEKDGRIQTIDGRDFIDGVDPESAIKWRANEGIRVSRIVAALKAAHADEPLLRAVFEALPHDQLSTALITPKESTMAQRQTINVAITIDETGNASFQQVGRDAAASPVPQAPPPLDEIAPFDAPFDADYTTRKGYAADFLGNGADSVGLPVLSDALEADAAPLLKPVGTNRHVLNYLGLSVVMNAKRRFAIYTAGNVDFAGRFALRRPRDVWRTDPRIAAAHQVGEFYYARNQFDRGHLTRRRDMEYGATRTLAIAQAADTFHYTNAAPQHAQFNQSTELWQGLERQLLEDSIERESFRAQVFTGPVLSEDDPVYARAPGIQYPVRFWKIAVAKAASGRLFAAAFILDQTEVIAQFGIEAAVIPFSGFKTFQVTVAEVERLTGLTFVSGADGTGRLRDVDPLKNGQLRRPRRPGTFEATGADAAPDGYVVLDMLEDVVGMVP